MKLNSFRPKDDAHVERLDKCGLITPAVVDHLPRSTESTVSASESRYDIDEPQIN